MTASAKNNVPRGYSFSANTDCVVQLGGLAATCASEKVRVFVSVDASDCVSARPAPADQSLVRSESAPESESVS